MVCVWEGLDAFKLMAYPKLVSNPSPARIVEMGGGGGWLGKAKSTSPSQIISINNDIENSTTQTGKTP